jgi:5-methyltetrahydropteroyltriglutamate--homocysteine methyltransferase
MKKCERVKTTVIGSYPIIPYNLGFMHGYFHQQEVGWKQYIDYAVKAQMDAGIDIICDGQTRDPFLNIFYRGIKGCRIRNRPEVIDKVEFKAPITLDDYTYVKSLAAKKQQIIGLIAGPYSLAQSCINIFYKDEKELAFDFAHALNNEAVNLQQHVDMISVDEPYFSVTMPDYAKELLDIVLSGITVPRRLHACGNVSTIVPELIELPVDILSHEFKASPVIFDAFSKYSFKQDICLGSVRSDKDHVESIDEIVKHMNHATEIFGDKICQVSPDCGQRMLPPTIAFKKLQNLTAARDIVYGG